MEEDGGEGRKPSGAAAAPPSLPTERRKRRRLGREAATRPPRGYADLMVPRPSAANVPLSRLVRPLLDRLEALGYTTVALAHTVYGPPTPVDAATATAADWEGWSNPGRFRVWRRLHAVVETLSHVGLYVLPPADNADDTDRARRRLLQDYDLVSLAPRNEATFRAACESATAAEIISLDYTVQRGGLPFRIRSADVRAATRRGAAFEVPYAPAILNPSHRRAWIRTLRELNDASRGCKPRVLLSSGCRTARASNVDDASALLDSQDDVGPLALRRPGDLVNVLECVCHMDRAAAEAAVSSENADWALGAGRQRRFGKAAVASGIVSVSVVDAPQSKATAAVRRTDPQRAPPTTEDARVNADAVAPVAVDEPPLPVEASPLDDGYIAF